MEKITVWSGSGHTKELFTKLVEEYNNSTGKEKGIQIEYTVYGGDYANMLEVALNTGKTANLVAIPAAQVSASVQKKQVVPLKELPGGEEWGKQFDKYAINNFQKFNGDLYTTPFMVNSIKLVYNKDMFKAAGIVDDKGEAKAPVTWDEVRDYAKKLTNPAKKNYGIAFPMKWGAYFEWELMYPFVSSVGHSYYDYEKGKYSFSDFKPAFEWLMSIKSDKSYFPGPESLDNDPARAQFAEGRVGMKLAASWDVGVYNDQFPAKNDWGVAAIPVLDQNIRYKEYTSPGNLLFVAQSAKDINLEKVFEVFKFFHNDDMITTMYEESKFIPYKVELANNAKKQPDKKGWAAFADTEKAFLHPPLPTNLITIEGPDYNQKMMEIWTGVISIEDGLADLDKRYNAALDKAIADGKVNIADYKVDNADLSIK